jgi:hypothetical protein
MKKLEVVSYLVPRLAAIGFLVFTFLSAGIGIALLYGFLIGLVWATHQPWCPDWFREYLRS